MTYRVDVFNTEYKRVSCSLGRGLSFEEAESIKHEGRNAFKPEIELRIIRERKLK